MARVVGIGLSVVALANGWDELPPLEEEDPWDWACDGADSAEGPCSPQ